VDYVDGFAGKSDVSATIDFLSQGLDLPLSEQEQNFIQKEKIDMNLYKIAKQYKLYKDTLNTSDTPLDGSIFILYDLSNILCTLIEESQHKIIKSSFDDFIINVFHKLKNNKG